MMYTCIRIAKHNYNKTQKLIEKKEKKYETIDKITNQETLLSPEILNKI